MPKINNEIINNGVTKNKCLNVLVVDDNPSVVNFIRIGLRTNGYEVITADEGIQALEKVHSCAVDLILLDIAMPGMNGIEMLKELRKFSSIPVIVISSGDNNLSELQSLGITYDYYFRKPFNMRNLLDRINSIRGKITQ